MSNLSPSWYLNFHNWIIEHNNTLDIQLLKCLNQCLHLLIELQELHDYNSTQQKVDELTDNCQQCEDKIKDIQFIKLLKFILIEIKDQIEFGKKKRNRFNDDGDFNNSNRSTLTSLYSRNSTSSTSARSSLPSSARSSLPLSARSSLPLLSKNYPQKTFDYLKDCEDNLYKSILENQLKIIYEVEDIAKNVESLKSLLLKHGPFPKKDTSLLLIIIYSTFQLLEKLKRFDNELIASLESFMKRIQKIILKPVKSYRRFCFLCIKKP
jgi:hypothetical protein